GPAPPSQITVPVAALDAWRARAQVVSALPSWAMTSAVIGAKVDAEEVTIGSLSPGLISELGARPLRGRDFEAADTERRVTILANDLWRTRFYSAPDAIGRSIRLDGQPYTVIGVMPAGFEFPVGRVRLWLPYAPPGPPARVRAIARLRGDVTFDQAAALIASSTHGFREQLRLPELRIAPLVAVCVGT